MFLEEYRNDEQFAEFARGFVRDFLKEDGGDLEDALEALLADIDATQGDIGPGSGQGGVSATPINVPGPQENGFGDDGSELMVWGDEGCGPEPPPFDAGEGWSGGPKPMPMDGPEMWIA